jgi:hypothetical protein
LGQILGNLISNAIKYTDNGYVRMEIDVKHREANKDLIGIRISDSGIGIPKPLQEQIFESFYQPESVSTRKKGGTGLGLAIVKRLIDLHESNIQVESEPEKGSSFSFNIWMVPSIAEVHAPSTISDKLSGKLALIAEDNMVNATVSKKLLSNWGAKSEHAVNGNDAIHFARMKKYDFILMDIHMPEMNGIEAARIIRSTENPNKLTPIFALTADINSDNDNHENLFNGILRKPIEIDKLFLALANA